MDWRNALTEVSLGEKERGPIWLPILLTLCVGATAWAGIASEAVPGVSPWPTLSVYYMLTGLDMPEPMPLWPLLLLYSSAFLTWAFVKSCNPPIRLTRLYLSMICVLTLANLAWILAFGGADPSTLLAIPIGFLAPLALLITGIVRRRSLRAKGVIVHGGLLFMWLAYGAFPTLPKAW